MTTEETPRNTHTYEVKEGHFKELGFWTLAEYAAYEKGREDGEKVTIDFVRKWDGSTNSVFGAVLKLKIESLPESENTRLRADRDGLLKTLEEMKKELESEKKDVAFLKGKINEIEKEHRETSHKLLNLQQASKQNPTK